MSSEVDSYFDALDEPKRSTLLEVRSLILEVEPRLEQVIAWGAPLFKFGGKYVAGLCAFKNSPHFSTRRALRY
jgi:uncharacterized protein YdhG (YjbR/CyaY superfamily)